MSFLCDLYFFQGQKYTSFGKNLLLRQSTSLGHSSTGHPAMYDRISVFSFVELEHVKLIFSVWVIDK